MHRVFKQGVRRNRNSGSDMSVFINRFGVILFTAISLIWITGCGKKDEQADVKELLVQAQELQQAEKYEDAIRTYRKIARNFALTRQGANSQFMIGYIYANHLKDQEQAKIELNRFLEEYSEVADSGLIVGAQFELKYMGMNVEEIPVLSEIGSADTTVAAGDEKEGE